MICKVQIRVELIIGKGVYLLSFHTMLNDQENVWILTSGVLRPIHKRLCFDSNDKLNQ